MFVYTWDRLLLFLPVLSNKGKRSIYDAGLISFLTDDDDEVSHSVSKHFFLGLQLIYKTDL